VSGRSGIVYQVALILLILFLTGLLAGCAPTIPQTTPPESYKGPVAERPLIQAGDYWVYERGNMTKGKFTALAPNLSFPMWVGKTWSYTGESVLRGQPSTSPHRGLNRIDCHAAAFKPVAVTAGTFGAFECQCTCTVTSGPYDPWCGDWTIWYAPEVKNVIRIKTEQTNTTMELVEYKLARPASGTKPVQ
jgi:hypothetical protein